MNKFQELEIKIETKLKANQNSWTWNQNTAEHVSDGICFIATVLTEDLKNLWSEQVPRIKIMGRYAAEPDNAAKAAKARGSNLRCHFKNTRETAQAIKKMPLHRATTYLKNVLNKTEIIPFRRFMGGKYFIF